MMVFKKAVVIRVGKFMKSNKTIILDIVVLVT